VPPSACDSTTGVHTVSLGVRLTATVLPCRSDKGVLTSRLTATSRGVCASLGLSSLATVAAAASASAAAFVEAATAAECRAMVLSVECLRDFRRSAFEHGVSLSEGDLVMSVLRVRIRLGEADDAWRSAF